MKRLKDLARRARNRIRMLVSPVPGAALVEAAENQPAPVTSEVWVHNSFQLLLGRKVDAATVSTRVTLSKIEQIKRLASSSEFARVSVERFLNGPEPGNESDGVDRAFVDDAVAAILGTAAGAGRAAGDETVAWRYAIELVLQALRRKSGKAAGWLDRQVLASHPALAGLDQDLAAIDETDALVEAGDLFDAFIVAGRRVKAGSAALLTRYLMLHYHLCWDLLSLSQLLRAEGENLPAELRAAFERAVVSAFTQDNLDGADEFALPVGAYLPAAYAPLRARPKDLAGLGARFSNWSMLKRFDRAQDNAAPARPSPLILLMPEAAAKQMLSSEAAALARADAHVFVYGDGAAPAIGVEAPGVAVTPVPTISGARAAIERAGAGGVLVAVDEAAALPLAAIARLPALAAADDVIAISRETLEIHPGLVSLSDLAGRSLHVIGFAAADPDAFFKAVDAASSPGASARRLKGERIVAVDNVAIRRIDRLHEALLVSLDADEGAAKKRGEGDNVAHIVCARRDLTAGALAERIEGCVREKNLSPSYPVLFEVDSVEYHPHYIDFLLKMRRANGLTPVSAVSFAGEKGGLAVRRRFAPGAPAMTQVGLLGFSCLSADEALRALRARPHAKAANFFFEFDRPAAVPDFGQALTLNADSYVSEAAAALAKQSQEACSVFAHAHKSVVASIESVSAIERHAFYFAFVRYKQRAELAISRFAAGDWTKLGAVQALLGADFLSVLSSEIDRDVVRRFLKEAFAQTFFLRALDTPEFERLVHYALQYGVQAECGQAAMLSAEDVVIDNPQKARSFFQLLNVSVSPEEFQAALMKVALAAATGRRTLRVARNVADVLVSYATPYTAMIFLRKLVTRNEDQLMELIPTLQKLLPMIRGDMRRELGLASSILKKVEGAAMSPPRLRLHAALAGGDRRGVIKILEEITAFNHDILKIIDSIRSYSAELAELKISSADWPYPLHTSRKDALKIACAIRDVKVIDAMYDQISDADMRVMADVARGSFAELNSLYRGWADEIGAAPVVFEGDSIAGLFRSVQKSPPRRKSPDEYALVSVIMSVYNGEQDLLTLSIESLFAQSHQNFEVFLIDDASDREFSALYREIASRDPRIHYHCMPVNLGPYIGRNFALATARGDFIAIQDADDYAHPDRFAIQLDAFLQNPYLKAVTSSNLRFDRSASLQFEHGMKLRGDGTMATMFRAGIFSDIGFFAKVRSRGDVEYRERIVKAFGPNAFRMLDCPLQFCYAAPTTLSQSVARERTQHLADFRTMFEAQLWRPLERAPFGDLGIPTLLRP